MASRKSKLDEYRLWETEFLGWKWQDKRDGDDWVYKRFFANDFELRSFLEETFGVRTATRVFKEKSSCINIASAGRKLLELRKK